MPQPSCDCTVQSKLAVDETESRWSRQHLMPTFAHCLLIRILIDAKFSIFKLLDFSQF